MNEPSQEVFESAFAELEDLDRNQFLHDEDPDLKITVEYGSLKSGTIGLASWNSDGCVIRVLKDLDVEKYLNTPYVHIYKDLLRIVILHELGHCFGMGHSKDPTDIMFHYINVELQDNRESLSRFYDALNEKRNE